jgi:hypothetical protein
MEWRLLGDGISRRSQHVELVVLYVMLLLRKIVTEAD